MLCIRPIKSATVGAIFLLVVGNAFGQTPSNAPIVWRVQNLTQQDIIFGIEAKFTTDKGVVNTISIATASIGPGREQDFKSPDGPCFLNSEAVVSLSKGSVDQTTLTKTIKQNRCIKGVHYMQLCSGTDRGNPTLCERDDRKQK